MPNLSPPPPAAPLLAFVGQTRDLALVAKLAELGVGECTQRGELDALERHRAARELGVDSIDSCLPLFTFATRTP